MEEEEWHYETIEDKSDTIGEQGWMALHQVAMGPTRT